MQRRTWIVVGALSGALGLTAGSGASDDARPSVAVDASAHTVVVHFGPGREVQSFRIPEPAGEIQLYQFESNARTRIRASTQVTGVTVPLWIATVPVGPSSSCNLRAGRRVCAAGEEGCPMPSAAWLFHVTKLAGPADVVTFRFEVRPQRS